jgi:hypothetical protein
MYMQMVPPEIKLFKESYEVFDDVVCGKFDKVLWVRLRVFPNYIGKKRRAKTKQEHYFFYLGYKVTVHSNLETRELEIARFVNGGLQPVISCGEGFYGHPQKTYRYDKTTCTNAYHALFEVAQLASDLKQFIR